MKPEKWELENDNGDYAIRRTYPDGTDVIVFAKKNNNLFEIWSSAISRTSGPNDHLDAKAQTLDEAVELVHKEASEWDFDFGF
jgi:hypothetical protein